MKKIVFFLIAIALTISNKYEIAANAATDMSAKSIIQEQKKIELLENKLKKIDDDKVKAGKKTNSLADSSKANIWYEMYSIFLKNNPGTAMSYAKKCLSLSEQIGYKKGIANGLASTGFVEAYYEGIHQPGLEKCKAALKLRGELGDKEGIAQSLTDIAMIYALIPNYPEALKNYFSALKILEEIGSKQQIANLHQSIGDIYSQSGDNESAREHYSKARKINQKLKNTFAQSRNLSMIAATYANEQQYQKAIQHYIEALSLTKNIGDKCEVSKGYKNLGNTYNASGKFPEALNSFNEAVKYSEESGDNNCIADASISLGRFNKDRGNLQSAMPHFRKGLSRALDGGSRELVSEGRKGLSDIHAALKISDNEELITRALKFESDGESQKKSTSRGMQYSPGPKRGLTQSNVRNSSDGRRSEKIDYGFILYISGPLILLIVVISLLTKRKKVAKKAIAVMNAKKLLEESSHKSPPSKTAEAQKSNGSMDEIRFDDVTVILIDSDLFTANNKELPPKEMVDEMNECFKRFDEIMAKYGIEKIEKLGNIYTTDSGLPISDKEKAETIANAAIEIRDFMKLRKENLGDKTFDVSICINCGDAIARIVGVKKITYDIWGAIVNIAARMEKSTETGKIYVTDSTYEHIKDTFTCEYYEEVAVKDNKKLKMYFVVNPTPKYTSDIVEEAQ